MPSYYVFDENSNKYIGMTREQIIAAIAEATGSTPTSIDDAFITKIKEENGSRDLKFWLGTQAQYNALSSPATNTLYIISDESNLYTRLATIENQLVSEKLTLSITNSHIKLYSSAGAITLKKYGKYVTISGVVSKNDTDVTIGSSSLVQFATIPSGYRPTQQVVIAAQGSNYAHWMFSIGVNGDMNISRYTLGAAYNEPDVGVWLPFHTGYIID